MRKATIRSLGWFQSGAAIALALVVIAASAQAPDTRYPQPLPSDSDLKVPTLPEKYPRTWANLVYASDKFEIRDVGSDGRALMAQLPGHESATLLVGKRP